MHTTDYKQKTSNQLWIVFVDYMDILIGRRLCLADEKQRAIGGDGVKENTTIANGLDFHFLRSLYRGHIDLVTFGVGTHEPDVHHYTLIYSIENVY